MPWQKEFSLPKKSKGCHLVTDQVLTEIEPGLKDVQIGVLYLFIKHTSAALTVNENTDPDVRKDMDMALDNIVPESLSWQHTDEGPDDSVSHTKSSLIGASVVVPITSGHLNLGTWQGIYLTEFRHQAPFYCAVTISLNLTVSVHAPAMIILQDDHQLPKFPSVAASPTPRVPERSSLHGLLPDYETSQAQVDGSHVKAALRRADARFWRAAAYATVIYLILSAVIATVIAKTVRHAYRPAPPPSAPWSDDDASSKGSAGYSVHLGEDTHLLDCNPWEIVDYNRSSRHYYSKFRTTLSAGGMFSVHSNVSAPQNGDGPHPVTGTLTVGLNPDRSVTDARLAVKMIAKRAELWTDVHVCLPGSADGKELWIYVPENLGSDSIYFDISLLYPHTSSPPLQVQSLATYLPVFQQHFGDLDPYVSFAKVTIQGAVSNITVDSLRGDKIRVKSSWAPITGFFNASESLTLDTMGAPIHTNITLVHTSKRKEPTFLSIDTGNSPIDAQITLLAPTASPLSLVRRPPAFHSELKTFNGPLHVAVAHSSTTPPAAVHLSAQNTLAECSVEMDRKYVGTFDVRTKLGAAEVREGGGGSVGAGNGTGAGVGVGERTYVYDLSAADRRFGWVGMGSRPTAWHSGGQGHVRVVSSLSTAKLILGET